LTAVEGDERPLADRAARGAMVTLAGQAMRMVLQLAGVVVLARLLSPHDYGLLAVAIVVVGVGEIFRDFGLSTAAIQARTLSAAERNALFWTNAAIGLVLTGLAIAIAPLVAHAYGEPALRPMLQVVAITFTCNGLATQYRADLTRRLQFGRLVGADVVGQAAGLALGVVGAVAGAGHWALVAQLVGQSAVALIAVAAAARWLPGRPRRGTDVRPFVRFGRMLALSAVVNYVSNNLDVLTISVRLGTTPLGIYNRAFSLLMSPLNQLRSPATTVALPVLSRLQDDYPAAGRYVARGQLAFGYSIGAALAICAGASTPIVHLMLGEKWSAAAPVLGFLAVAGASTLLAYPGYWVYLSRGLGPALFRYTCVTLVLQAVCIIAGSWWGITGVAAGYMIAAVLEWPLSLFWLARLTVLPLRELLTGALRVTACGGLAGAATWLAVHATGDPKADANVALGLATGLAVYAVLFALVPAVRRDVKLVGATGRRMLRR